VPFELFCCAISNVLVCTGTFGWPVAENCTSYRWNNQHINSWRSKITTVFRVSDYHALWASRKARIWCDKWEWFDVVFCWSPGRWCGVCLVWCTMGLVLWGTGKDMRCLMFWRDRGHSQEWKFDIIFRLGNWVPLPNQNLPHYQTFDFHTPRYGNIILRAIY